MTGLSFSKAAVADLRDIWVYTATTWGEDQADAYTDDIEVACVDLASGKRLGRSVQERPGYFRYAVGRHLVFYTLPEGGIRVVRILHQRMDVEARL